MYQLWKMSQQIDTNTEEGVNEICLDLSGSFLWNDYVVTIILVETQ